VKLQPTAEPAQDLLQTLERANAACDYISQRGWEAKGCSPFKLQKLVYSDVRARFDLSAQMVIRILTKVCDAYQLDQQVKRLFRKHGAIAYDDRILKGYTDRQRVSIWSVGGRLNLPYQCGDHQRALLQWQKGGSDLLYSKGEFYWLATCDIPDPTEQETETALGVDLGLVNSATTRDGETMTSATIEGKRQQHQRLRTDLQKRGTLSAQRHLRKLAGDQARFQKDLNHGSSKRLVLEAEHTKRAIALEDLTGIRTRTRVKGKQERARRSHWAFAQLRFYIAYQAKRHGVKRVVVDPHSTSQRCFACGHIAKANRKSHSEFSCCACGHTAHADVNAANNIAWVAVMQPIVSDTPATIVSSIAEAAVAPETSPRL
jgi:IS605 OrfB family transposase